MPSREAAAAAGAAPCDGRAGPPYLSIYPLIITIITNMMIIIT